MAIAHDPDFHTKPVPEIQAQIEKEQQIWTWIMERVMKRRLISEVSDNHQTGFTQVQLILRPTLKDKAARRRTFLVGTDLFSNPEYFPKRLEDEVENLFDDVMDDINIAYKLKRSIWARIKFLFTGNV